ncbi:transcriptional regulator [Acidocella aquatica]|jgi:transcriptional regulator with XRE-family HTH domain|uniref:Transcriptional regulator n=1 Tax=Acidocella aquatica TaxID=1922313 RepID=A0ABQ6A780_9PROT|nr:transcriptional regulator [Acidocella aquatica]
MKIYPLLVDQAVTEEIGRRITAYRISRQMTQAAMAAEAGVSKRTVERLEAGEPTQLTNFIRCLRSLGRLEALELLLPELPPSPIAELERQGLPRQRVRSVGKKPARKKAWNWGDQK